MRMQSKRIPALFLLLSLMIAACGRTGSGAVAESAVTEMTQESSTAADDGTSAENAAVAAADETVAQESVGREGMVPVPGTELRDGVYEIQVDSSSSMFQITSCALLVQDGNMTAVLTMGGSGYLFVYPGSGEEAAAAAETQYIPAAEDAEGRKTFTVPVKALDEELPLAAFSKRKEKWYDRTLVFRADTLPAEAFREGSAAAGQSAESLRLADGVYQVSVELEGGSGRAAVETPAELRVSGGICTARITFSSPNYDYMLVDGVRYEPVNTEGNSSFEIPVRYFDRKLTVYADTTAMSTPHEIQYTLYFEAASIETAGAEASASASFSRDSLSPRYASQFAMEPCSEGCVLLTIGGSERYLIADRGAELPDMEQRFGERLPVIRRPVSKVYIAASSAMEAFLQLDALSALRMSGTRREDWSFPEVQRAMDEGALLYAGKYSAPDYERLLTEGCGLALESTMIYHTPAVREQLTRLGIPVLVERSSYEDNPLGRMEWVRLYGYLTGREAEAERIVSESVAALQPILREKNTERSVAFFYVSANGSVNVRRPGDYMAELIELSGGRYIFRDRKFQKSGNSGISMQMEDFYAGAKDADILIYSGTIGGELESIRELIEKNSLFQDFKAVKEGAVWCSGKNLFQHSVGVAEIIAELNQLIRDPERDPEQELCYFRRLN